MTSANELFESGKARHRAGHWHEALALYRQVVEALPNHLEARMLLGSVYLATGQPEDAVECFRLVLRQQPDNVECYDQLAVALGTQQKLDESLACLRRRVELRPTSAEAHQRLGALLAHLSRSDEAATCFRQAIALRPDFVQAHYHLGLALAHSGHLAAAELHFRRSIQLAGDLLPAYYHLAATLDAEGQLDQAVECLRRAVAIRPDLAQGYDNLGVALARSGRLDEAEGCFRRALELNPLEADAQNNLGSVLERQGRSSEAASCFRAALELRPDFGGATHNLAAALLAQGLTAEARQCYADAACHHPHDPIWQLNEISVCPTVFECREQIDAYRGRLLARLREFSDREVRFDLSALERSGCRPSFLLLAHGQDDRPIREQYARIFQRSFLRLAPRGSVGRPRLGMVVTRGHEGGFYRSIGGVVERMGGERFELILLAARGGRDLLRSLVKNPDVSVLTLPDTLAQAATMIAEERCDVLYHWEIGTDNLNYFLPYFRLAPLQCTSWGVQSSSGIPTVDAYLSSALLEPADAQRHFSERLILADTLLLYQARAVLPRSPKTRQDFGLPADAHVYACAQRLEKLHPDFDEILLGILRDDPHAMVVIVRSRHGEYVAELLRQRFQRRLGDLADRILFLPYLANPDYLSLVAAADVMLDPLHYGGVNSSYDAFALGQPVVTLPGAFQQGRFTMACYEKMGMSECVATSPDEYVRIAVKLGACPDERARVRGEIERSCGVLFEDPRCVSEHERIFGALIDQARQLAGNR
jgi:protein O-GlcNAc transferase